MTEVRNRMPALASLALPRRRVAQYVQPVPASRMNRSHPLSQEQLWARSYRLRLLATDTLIIVTSVVVAFLTRFGVHDGIPGADSPWLQSLAIVLAWSFALCVQHTRDTRVAGVGTAEYRRVANASVFAFGFLAILFLLLKVDVPRGYFLLALPLGIAGLTTSRWLWRNWLTERRTAGHYLARALVVGSQEDVGYVIDQIVDKSGAVFNIVGAVLDNTVTRSLSHCTRNVPVVGGLSDVGGAAARLGVDTVIVTGRPIDDCDFIRDLSRELEGTATELVLASRLTDVAGPRIHFRPMEGLPLIHVEIPRFEGGKHVLKRALDIVVSGVALLILLPFMVFLGILIRLDSPGPAIFRQERVGREERIFTMLKLRTMVQSAESDLAGLIVKNEGAGVLFKIKDDPRVTRIGRILRKYSLDEFPQIWNVLVGDMSLVGPRPPLQHEVLDYERHVHRRLYIKPGLTGMWQVSGRSDLSWEESVRLDLYYVENWSLTGDLMIIWRTFKVLLTPVGAY